MYKCSGGNPISSHIASEMFGVVVVDDDTLPVAEAEYVLVQHEK